MHKILKLQHHSHTGKVLAHHHTSYRALLLLLGLTGIFLGGMQYTAHADDLVVTATRPAAPLTMPAVITNPVDGAVVDRSNILVQGTCQFVAPVSIVAIYGNGNLLGSSTCSPGGFFSLTVNLTVGANELIAKTSNITGGYAPDSAPVTVIYIAPPLTALPSTTKKPKPTKAPSTGSGLALLMGSPNAFIIFGPRKDAVWIGSITGGTGPYSLKIDWGDGATKTLRKLGTEELQLWHSYESMRTHFITITISDARGASREYSFAAVTPFIGGSLRTSPVQPWFDTPLALQIYGLYMATIGVWALIWLDARHLRPQPIFVYKKRRKDKKRSDKS